MTMFQVDSEQVSAANLSIQATIGRLQQEVGSLHAQLMALEGSWRGVAADSFQQLALRWRDTAQAVELQLSEIGRALELAARQYQETELFNQRLFLG